MPVIVHHGDIFKARVEALVVPANVQPALGWGSHISERLKKMVSERVIEERTRYGKIGLGEACLTSGEGSPFKYLIHAAVLDKYDLNPLFLLRLRQRTSDQTLRSAARNTLKIIDEYQIKSAAISAMGSGIGGMNYKKCCGIIFEEVRGHPCEIHFAVYRPKHAMIAENELGNT